MDLNQDKNYETMYYVNRRFMDCGLPVPFNQAGLMNRNSQLRPRPGCCITNKGKYKKPAPCDK